MNLTINVKDITGYPTPIAIVGTGTNIQIGVVVTPNVNTATATVTNNTFVTVVVTKGGYNTYTNTFRVYTGNETITIILVPVITSIVDPNYRKPFPYFHVIKEPYTFNVHVYSTTSQPYGNYKYYLNDVEKEAQLNANLYTVEPGTFAIKQNIEVLLDPSAVQPSVLWNINYSSDVVLVEYRPLLSLSVTNENQCQDDNCQAVIDELVTVTPDIVLNSLIGTGTGTIVYTLTDYSDTLVETVSYPVNLDGTSLPTDIDYEFTPVLLGDYKLTAVLSNEGVSCTKTIIITTCNFLKIAQDCHKMIVTNCSLSKNVNLQIYDRTATTPINIATYSPSVLNNGNTITIPLPKDGIYIVKLIDIITSKVYYFTVIDYCDLRNCYEKIIKSILCADESTDCGCHDDNRYMLNRMIALGQEYFSYIQSFYGFNNIYEALSEGQIQDLFEMQTLYDKLNKWCGCNMDKTTLGGCGCH